MDTSNLASTKTNPAVKTPKPGNRVFIREGDFGGEVGTVGALVAPQQCVEAGRTLNVNFNPPVVFDGVHILAAFVDPANVQPVPTEFEDVPANYDADEVDPWTERIASWLHSLEGEVAVLEGITTGEILERAIGQDDGFTQQVRVGNILRGLGYEKIEVSQGSSLVWHWKPVNGKLQAKYPIPERRKYEAEKGNASGLVIALASLISWLFDKSGSIERLARFAEAILDARQFKLRKDARAYFEWAAQGGDILHALKCELEAQNTEDLGDVLCCIVLGHASGETGADKATLTEFHRTMVNMLVNGLRHREGLSQTLDESDRSPLVNGWLLALAQQAKIVAEMAEEAHRGIGIPKGANQAMIASEYAREAWALRWIVEAAGGLEENDLFTVPMLDLAEKVDMNAALGETLVENSGMTPTVSASFFGTMQPRENAGERSEMTPAASEASS